MYDLNFRDSAFTSFALIRQTWIAVNKVAEIRLGRIGLTPEKTAVLWACRDYRKTVTPAEIARLVFRENQTVAGLLNRMEKEGLIKRTPKRKGHPFTEIKLTEKGSEACAPAISIVREVVTEVMENLPDEKSRQLRELLLMVRDRALESLYLEPRPVPGYKLGEPLPVKW